MRTLSLLLLVALVTLAEFRNGNRRRLKQKVLVRNKRRWVLSTIELKEEDPGPYPLNISQMFNNMSGSHHEFRISGMGVDEPPVGLIGINPDDGMVYAKGPIDRETYFRPFHIKFRIFDRKSGTELDKELSFDVEIKDINDNKPTFLKTAIVENVKENTPQGFLPVQLDVSDADQENTSNSYISIRIVSQEPKEPRMTVAKISSRMSRLNLEGCLDYDKHNTYKLIIEAKDHGVPPLSSTAVVTLNIVDTNTHLPTFKSKEYQGVVNESTIQHDVLRIAVDDKDTPGTPGWRAVYYFISGNEDGNYKLETDPKTNEGILSVIKGKDFERTTNTTLQIGVKNEEDIWTCNNASGGLKPPPPNTVNITMKVIDVNDPPEFKTNPANVYQKEEEKPGKLLFSPVVHDVDSDLKNIRYKLLHDPANWVTIDPKTGNITSAKKMDRESPFVNASSNTYKVLIGAIDDGAPPATGTCTVLIHLGDINDNKPYLVNKGVIMCGNKVNKVPVLANDSDVHPFSGPFSFSLGGDDKSLAQQWKLQPAFGQEGGLVSLKTLPYGNYSVPLVIRDQQNMIGLDTIEVMVCDCRDKDFCRGRDPITANVGGAAIALILLGLLLFLLLLLIFACQCGQKDFKHIPMLQDEGNQTLIKYNQEGGGSECKAEPTRLLTPVNNMIVPDGLKQGNVQMSQMAPVMAQDMDTFNSARFTSFNSNSNAMGMQRQRDTFRSQRGQSMYSSWNASRMNSYQTSSSRYNRSLSLRSNQHLADHIDRRLYMIDGNHLDFPEYRPYEYAYEGQGSKCQSLDQLSLSDAGDDLKFLNNLGPKFKTLGGICQQTIKDKNIQL